MAEITVASMTAHRERKITDAVTTYGRRLMGFIRNQVRSESDAEDLMQDVWLQLSRVGDVDQIEQLGAWLFRVAKSKIIDNSRKRRALPVSNLQIKADEEETIEDLLFVENTTPETETLRRILWEEFWIAIEELPKEQRNVFVWNELDDLTFDEIARRTGENPKTLISRKRYAIQKLRARLEVIRNDFLND